MTEAQQPYTRQELTDYQTELILFLNSRPWTRGDDFKKSSRIMDEIKSLSIRIKNYGL